ncbi:MAG: transcription antitermination factor NusB [Oceanospirillaceae bacterium]|jgi:N utilization substance protein B|nr:transcription antitermination factor NusB [Oceanospirillaceae bacterium]MBT4442510.1 transcription antitermination factor NusB [Oceanospirillaceae bacterium]MBT6077679.1 transcription antitermination factor NusB [Oceanospirillaceae bacterium]MBT7331479.1 transcription antitermination factor NusB [Oceanospirillaceae bacterium]
MSATKGRPDRRRGARELALQALYQLHMSGASAVEVQAQFLADQDFKNADKRMFGQLLRGVAAQTESLDGMIEQHLDRKLAELDPIELAVLRLGAFELTDSVAVPYRVVINECIELGKVFGATDGHKYVNGILDKLAIEHRAVEIAAKKSATPR